VKLRILIGDARERLKEVDAGSVQMVMTSPPYFNLRNYNHEGQIGLEGSPSAYVEAIVDVFRAVRRVLSKDGVVFLNLGDSYARDPKKGQHKPGHTGRKQAYVYDQGGGRASSTFLGDGLKEKDLIGIPWMVAFAMRADGWFLRQELIWHKPNGMPDPAKDRCVGNHEQLFLLSKSPRYFFDYEAIMEPTVCDRMRGPALHRDTISTNGNGGLGRRPVAKLRRKRSVWSINTRGYSGKHYAAFPEELVRPTILAGSRPGDLVLDPFAGSGTTARVALQEGRRALLVDVNPEYETLMRERVL
jgi:DNA modification methylase